MTRVRSKQLHINLDTRDQIADYATVRDALGIRRDADLIRYLLRKEAESIRIDARFRARLALIRATMCDELAPVLGEVDFQ